MAALDYYSWLENKKVGNVKHTNIVANKTTHILFHIDTNLTDLLLPSGNIFLSQQEPKILKCRCVMVRSTKKVCKIISGQEGMDVLCHQHNNLSNFNKLWKQIVQSLEASSFQHRSYIIKKHEY